MGLKGKSFFVARETKNRPEQPFFKAMLFFSCGVIAENGDRDGIPSVIPEAHGFRLPCFGLRQSRCLGSLRRRYFGFFDQPIKSSGMDKILREFFKKPQDFVRIRKGGVKRAKEAFGVMRTVRSLRSEIETVIQES